MHRRGALLDDPNSGLRPRGEDPVQHIADHEARATEILPLVHRVLQGRRTMAVGMAKVFQRLEDRIYAAWKSRTLDLATGTSLDWWGWLAGVGPRGGLSDGWYRRLIRTGFMAKYADGSIEDCIKLWELATSPSEVRFFGSDYTGGNMITLVCFRDRWMPENYARRAAEVVRRGCPVGTTVLLEALTIYCGSSEYEEGYPYPATPPTSAPGAKDW